VGLGAGVVGMGGSAAETDPRWRLSNWSALSGSPMSGAAGPALPTGQQLLMPPPPLDSQGRPLAVVLHGPVAVAYPHLPTQGAPWYSIHTLPPFGAPGGPPPNSLCLPPTMNGYCLPTMPSGATSDAPTGSSPTSQGTQLPNALWEGSAGYRNPQQQQQQLLVDVQGYSHEGGIVGECSTGVAEGQAGGAQRGFYTNMKPPPHNNGFATSSGNGNNAGVAQLLEIQDGHAFPNAQSAMQGSAVPRFAQEVVARSTTHSSCSEDAEEEEGLEEEDEGGESDQDRVVARKPSKSRSWTAQEDQLVRDLVKEHGLRKWAFIASCLEGKTQKQVYARWRDYLQPGISCQPWSKQEQKLLVALHMKVGNQWAVLAKMMPGRSPNAIKNRFHATRRKLERSQKRLGCGEGEDAANPNAGDVTMEDGMPMNAALVEQR